MAKLYVTYRLNGQLETSEWESRRPLDDINHGPTLQLVQQGHFVNTLEGLVWIAPAAIESVSTYPPLTEAEPEAEPEVAEAAAPPVVEPEPEAPAEG